MWKRMTYVAVAVLMVGMVSSCILDPKPGKTPPTGNTGPLFKDLSTKDNVVYNLLSAYNHPNNGESVTQYQALLDPGFTFFFSPGDVGGTVPQQWGVDQEVPSFMNLMNDISSISLSFSPNVQKVALQWESFTLPADSPYAGETWYRTTVTYNFNIQVKSSSNTYITSGTPQAEFAVRQTTRDGKQVWQLMQWYDLAN